MKDLIVVMKALDGCTGGKGCDNCPYDGDGNCKDRLLRDALDLLKEQNRLISELSENIPCCDNCDGKTALGERTDKCVYEIEGFDSIIYCAKRGIENCFGYRKKIEELENKYRAAIEMAAIATERRGEVEPVVHAHWTFYEDESGEWWDKCSRCGGKIPNEGGYPSDLPRCPHCGAHMDEEVDDA